MKFRDAVRLAAAAPVAAGCLALLPGVPAVVRGAVQVVAQLLLLLLVIVVSLRHAWSSRGDHRKAGLLLAAACVVGVLAEMGVVLVAAMTGGPPPVPSWIDGALLGFCVLVLLALVSVPLRSEVSGSCLLALLDGAVASACLLFLALAVVLPAVVVRSDLSTMGRVVAAAHPVVDVLVAATALAMLGPAVGRSRVFLGSVGLAFLVLGTTNVVFMVLVAHGVQVIGHAVGVGLLLATALLVVAASALPAAEQPAPDGRDHAVAWAVHVPVLLALPAAVAAAMSGQALRFPLDVVALTAGVALSARGFVSARDHGRLAGRLTEALASVRAEQEHFRALVAGSSDLTTLLDHRGVITWQSDAVRDVLGYDPVELLGSDVRALVHPEDLPAALGQLALGAPGAGTPVKVEHRARRQDGSWTWVETGVQDELRNPAVRAVVLHTRNTDAQHVLEQRLRHQAYVDPVTGLANRFRLHESLAIALCRDGAPARARLLEPPVHSAPHLTAPPARPSGALLLLDLDGFKAVNDSLGHAAGDEVLAIVAERMRACLREDDLVARLGGDEFAVLICRPGPDLVGEAEVVAARLLEEVARPVAVAGRSLVLGASIGIAELAVAATVDEALRNADLAMYAAKAAGKGRASLFTPSLHARAVEQLELAGDLRVALARGELSVVFQPIYLLPTDGAVPSPALAGAEALVRWSHPVLGPVPPDRFVALAEDTGLIHQLGHFVLDEACRQVSAWQGEGLHLPVVTVNVSPQELRDGYAHLAAQKLSAYGVSPERLVVEVTESSLMRDLDSARRTLVDLRALGVRIAIDDFGTGYSSLAQLRRLPVDILKIDKAFVDEIAVAVPGPGGENAARFLGTIIEFGHQLGLRVVAEGVEDPLQLARLTELGCDYAQGYQLSRPLEARLLSEKLPFAPHAPGPTGPAAAAASPLAEVSSEG